MSASLALLLAPPCSIAAGAAGMPFTSSDAKGEPAAVAAPLEVLGTVNRPGNEADLLAQVMRGVAVLACDPVEGAIVIRTHRSMELLRVGDPVPTAVVPDSSPSSPSPVVATLVEVLPDRAVVRVEEPGSQPVRVWIHLADPLGDSRVQVLSRRGPPDAISAPSELPLVPDRLQEMGGQPR